MPNPTGRPRETTEQILTRVDRSGGPDACWPWTGNFFDNGYGRFGQQGAHRLVFRLLTGIDPGAEMVLHSCDNKPCCNPAHLRLGSPQDNMTDKVSRGRWVGHHDRVITVDMVTAARHRVPTGERLKDIAAEFGVSHVSLSSAVRGKTFRWLADPPPLSTCRIPGCQSGSKNNGWRGGPDERPSSRTAAKPSRES